MKQFKKNGFTLIEAIFSLLVTSVVSLLGMLYLQSCANLMNIRSNHQDQMAILQMRQILSISKSIEVNQDSLSFIYEGKAYQYEFDRNRLVKRDGYEILMERIESVYFYEEDEEIFLEWTKDKKTYKAQLV